MKPFALLAVVMLVISVCCAQNDAVLKPLKIDFKNRGYFYASSVPLKSTRGLGGWGGSDNRYQQLTTQNFFEESKLSVILRVEEPAVFAGKYAGYALYVVNARNDTVFFEAQDSRLDMKLQALDKDGEWRDIEYLPGSWCGNSYHQLYLPSHYFWKFAVPEYKGTLKTRIRAALSYLTAQSASAQWIYSNEIEGSVNKGQFTKIPKYQPNGMMDPYDN